LAAGVQRQGQLQRADLVVWCQSIAMTEQDALANEKLLKQCQCLTDSLVTLGTKGDLLPQSMAPGSTLPVETLRASALTGAGITEFKEYLARRLQDSNSNGELTGATAARCQESLQNASAATERALSMSEAGAGDELIALELREILEHLGRVVGQVYTDDILDRIFSRFCIGK